MTRMTIKRDHGLVLQIYDKDDNLATGPIRVPIRGEDTFAALEIFLQFCGVTEKEGYAIREVLEKDDQKEDALVVIMIYQGGRDFLLKDYRDELNRINNEQ